MKPTLWESVEHTEAPAQQTHTGLEGLLGTISSLGSCTTQSSRAGWNLDTVSPSRARDVKATRVCFLVAAELPEPKDSGLSTSQLPVMKFCMLKYSSSCVWDVTFHANFMPLFNYGHKPNPPWLTGKASRLWLTGKASRKTAVNLLTVHLGQRGEMYNEIIKSRRKTYLEPASNHRWVLRGKRRCV